MCDTGDAATVNPDAGDAGTVAGAPEDVEAVGPGPRATEGAAPEVLPLSFEVFISICIMLCKIVGSTLCLVDCCMLLHAPMLLSDTRWFTTRGDSLRLLTIRSRSKDSG